MPYINRKQSRPGTTRRGRMLGLSYASPGYYFLTMCSHDRQLLFGEVSNGTMNLSPSGEMLSQLIPEMELRFSTVSLDRFVIMPNHVHILLGLCVRLTDVPDTDNVSDIVKWFKNTSIRRYGLGVTNVCWPRYQGKLWQAGFHDHYVRNDTEFETLRAYTENNVAKWDEDTFNGS